MAAPTREPLATPELAATMGLTTPEFEMIAGMLGRTPNVVEVGMFAVMWSEHCGYKYSKNVLRHFKRYREALEGAGHENAGVIPIGDGLGVAFKVESHNHPSAVEPHQGAATGVGGILRDIFTMGARPIACLNSLRFGPLEPGPQTSEEVAQRNRYLFEHVVAGIGRYGNCVGVPTVGGEVAFHPRYSGNPLVNAMAVGLVALGEVTTAGATGVGNPVIYLGSATGKDGIHGATFASDTLDEGSEDRRPNVQIGDPFAEKLLIEATLEALRTGAIQSIQDMGAAGLTCSTTEMAAKGGVGMDVNLDLVPMRERGMTAYELMLSESQERMLCVAHQGREREVIEVFQKWGLHAVVIGHVTDSGRVRISRDGDLVADVDPIDLAERCPLYSTPYQVPEYARAALNWRPEGLPVAELESALETLLDVPTLASKRWVYRQYDQHVQTQTVTGPGEAGAAFLAPRGTAHGLAVSLDGNGYWTFFDPYAGGLLAVCEAARNLACVGARPVGATDGLNFGDPRDPEVYWQLDECVRGIAEAAEALATPVVSGNVSLYNESTLGEVLPTAMIGMIGISPNAERRVTQAWADGRSVALVRPTNLDAPQQGLGASAFLQAIHGIEDGVPMRPNLQGERALHDLLVEGIAVGQILAAHDVSEGGLALTLAEMAIASGVGAVVDLSPLAHLRPDAALFGEWPGWVVIALDRACDSEIRATCARLGLQFDLLGQAEGDHLVVREILPVDLRWEVENLRCIYESAIPRRLEVQ